MKFHEIDRNPISNKKLAALIESISNDGWQGLPLLADGEQLLTGCHRATACEILGIEPEVHQLQVYITWGDDPYGDYLLNNLANAARTDQLKEVIQALFDEGWCDEISLQIILAEGEHEEN